MVAPIANLLLIGVWVFASGCGECEPMGVKTMGGNKSQTDLESGAGTAEGYSVDPANSLEDSTETKKVSESEIESIPIGIPMDPEEYRRLKQEAEQPLDNQEDTSQAKSESTDRDQ